MPEWLQAVILGIVQGITEFVPVSSSGHLVLLPHLAGWERPGLAFDVALHLGTAAALVVYFRRDLAAMARSMLGSVGRSGDTTARRLAGRLALASVPVAVVGMSLKSTFEQAFEAPGLAACLLLVTATLLVTGESLRARRIARRPAPVGVGARGDGSAARTADDARPVGHDPADPEGTTLERLSLSQATAVGAAQAAALFPGLSRSGTTITTGLAVGLTREAATRFSFLLALPALLGAFIVSLPDLAEPGPYSGLDIGLGVLASFVAGYAAIAFLVRLVARTGVAVFSAYLVVAALGSLVALGLGVGG